MSSPRWDAFDVELRRYRELRETLDRTLGDAAMVHSFDEITTSWRKTLSTYGLDPADEETLFTVLVAFEVSRVSVCTLLARQQVHPVLHALVEGCLNNIGVTIAELLPAEARRG